MALYIFWQFYQLSTNLNFASYLAIKHLYAAFHSDKRINSLGLLIIRDQ